MPNFLNILPWVLSAVLGAGLFWSQQESAKKDTALAHAQNRYDALKLDTNAEIAEINGKLAAADAKLSETVDAANRQLQVANLRETPMTVRFRKALITSGSVAQISNSGSESAAFSAVVERPSTSQSKKFEITPDSGAMKEIGENQGWAFVAGDTITIQHAGHKSLSFTAP